MADRDPLAMDAVCPLIHRDVGQARLLLLPSLRTSSLVRHLWVIAPPDDVAKVRRDLKGADPGFEITVLPETAVVPELTYFPGRKRGWYRQQLLKLAMVDLVGTENFLTLDGDICCMRPCRGDTFVRDGRALLVGDPPGFHPEWYTRSASLLGLPVPSREMSVTPVIFNRSAIAAMAGHIEENVGVSRRIGRLLPPSEPRRFLSGWRGILLRSMPWTEMALYLTFLDGTGTTGRYHWEDPSIRYYGGNVWSRDEAKSWSPRRSVEGATGDPEYHFAVFGSKTGLNPHELRDALVPFLPHLAG